MRWIALLLIASTAYAVDECHPGIVLNQIRPSAEWVMTGDTIDGLRWLDATQQKPTRQELSQGVASCQAAVAQRKRNAETYYSDMTNRNLTVEARFEALIKYVEISSSTRSAVLNNTADNSRVNP